MKRIGAIAVVAYVIALHIALFVALFLPSHFPDWAWRLGWDDPEPTPYAMERHRQLTALDRASASGGVVLIGDSHAEQFDPILLQQPIRIMAVGGDTARHLAQRAATWKSLGKTRIVMLWAGYNDLTRRSADAAAQDMAGLVQQIPAGPETIVLSVTPVRDAAQNAKVRQLNAASESFCIQSGECRFVDLTALLLGQDGLLAPKFDRGDGTHLNQSGYKVVSSAINSAIETGNGD